MYSKSAVTIDGSLPFYFVLIDGSLLKNTNLIRTSYFVLIEGSLLKNTNLIYTFYFVLIDGSLLKVQILSIMVVNS